MKRLALALTRRRLRRAFVSNFIAASRGEPAAKVNAAILANRLRDLDAGHAAMPGLHWLRLWCPFAFCLAAWVAGFVLIFGFLAGIWPAA